MGKTLMDTEAKIAPQFFEPNSSEKYKSPVCTVFNLESLIKVMENSKSFHLKKNCNTSTVTMEFFISGVRTYHIRRKIPQPSITAASMMSSGKERRYPFTR